MPTFDVRKKMKKHAILLLALLSISAPLQAKENPRSVPEITASDLATFEGISWVKGQLPNQDGFRIKSSQVFLGEKNEMVEAITSKVEIEYSAHRYSDTGELSDPLGFLYVAIQPTAEGLKVGLVVKNNDRTSRSVNIIEELKGYSVVQTMNPRHQTGNATWDYGYVVPSGEMEIFMLKNQEGSIKTLTLSCEPDAGGNG
tara:strand:+ start:1482 stop:2081 length:600 start_codon:yes stop_codon:yes gene_type:complete